MLETGVFAGDYGIRTTVISDCLIELRVNRFPITTIHKAIAEAVQMLATTRVTYKQLNLWLVEVFVA